MNDIKIAHSTKIFPIIDIAKYLGLTFDDISLYGKYKAKINLPLKKELNTKKKMILVTSINPTRFGEGKSTITIGLSDALHLLGKKAIVTLREPSLGPVMGLKGGATGGGYAQVIPMEDINLHFTGDMHAITCANNMLSALIDNHIYQGNELNIDPRRILWKRVLDINDRSLRNIVIGLGGPTQGIPREDGFDITVASELMAILCLSSDIDDLKNRISKIVIGYTFDKLPITVNQLGATDAITLLLKDAIKPNLVQTLEHTPAIIHGGPFANIAHGCNSIIALKVGLSLADYTVTEAGFGSDLGAEKFLDIVCPILKKTPDVIVIVVTIRALKMNGAVKTNGFNNSSIYALKQGLGNLKHHIKNMRNYGIPVTVAINKFNDDSNEEIDTIINFCNNININAYVSESWSMGSKGSVNLANDIINKCQFTNHFIPLYSNELSLKEKIYTLVTKIYGGSKVEYSIKAQKQIAELQKFGWDRLPICISKTPYSFSDDPKLLGDPKGFTFHINEIIPKIGAGFLVALSGNVLTMPGLPKNPAANNMFISSDGSIDGLF